MGVGSAISFVLGIVASYYGSLIFHKFVISKRPKGDYVSVDYSIGGNDFTMTYAKDVERYKGKKKKPSEVEVLEKVIELISGKQ